MDTCLQEMVPAEALNECSGIHYVKTLADVPGGRAWQLKFLVNLNSCPQHTVRPNKQKPWLFGVEVDNRPSKEIGQLVLKRPEVLDGFGEEFS